MGLYVGDTRVAPVIMATPIYRGSYNIVTDLGLTTTSSQSDIITALENEISTPQYANYCFVDIPYANYSEVSGYDQFTTTSEYIDYYVLVGDAYTLVTADNKDTLGIIVGTTVAYSVSHTSYFEKIQRYRYNGNSWEYEYDVDFSGYANIDANNFTDVGTTFLSGLGMPSNRYEDLIIGASGTEYTMPENGLLVAICTCNSNVSTASIQFQCKNTITAYKPIGWIEVRCSAFVCKNETFKIYYRDLLNFNILRLYYLNGNPTPPQP